MGDLHKYAGSVQLNYDLYKDMTYISMATVCGWTVTYERLAGA